MSQYVRTALGGGGWGQKLHKKNAYDVIGYVLNGQSLLSIITERGQICLKFWVLVGGFSSCVYHCHWLKSHTKYTHVYIRIGIIQLNFCMWINEVIYASSMTLTELNFGNIMIYLSQFVGRVYIYILTLQISYVSLTPKLNNSIYKLTEGDNM